MRLPMLCPGASWRSAVRRNSRGMTRSLLTMLDKATLTTITMPVAAENPPI